jgi:exosortase/archaeosortase family protein
MPNSQNNDIKKFIILYVLYMIIAFVLIEYESIKELLQLDRIYTGSVVWLSTHLIELIGIGVTSSGPFLHLHSAVMEVKFGCNGLEAILLFCAAVLAYPASWKQRVYGIVLGSTLLQFFNLLRIALLAWVLEFHRDIFDVMHEYITQSIMIVIAFVVFLIYLQYVNNEKITAA